MDCEHAVERGLVDGLDRAVDADTGIVDENVEAPPALEGRCNDLQVGLGIGDVADSEAKVEAFLVKSRGGQRRAVGVDILDKHCRTTLGEEPGGCLANSRTGAGDDSDATLELAAHPSSATMMVSPARQVTVTVSPIAWRTMPWREGTRTVRMKSSARRTR